MPAVDNTTMAALAQHCNVWRTYYDVYDVNDAHSATSNKHSLMNVINYWSRPYADYHDDPFLYTAGPGQWNDADQIIAGDFGLRLFAALCLCPFACSQCQCLSFSPWFPSIRISDGQATTQFALWAIFASPLLMGNDLRDLEPKMKALLQNEEVIAVSQDPLGKQGALLWEGAGSETKWQRVYMRELAGNDSIAVVLHNRITKGFGNFVRFNSSMVPPFVSGWDHCTVFTARNLLNHSDIGTFQATLSDFVRPHAVGIYKLTPQSQSEECNVTALMQD